MKRADLDDRLLALVNVATTHLVEQNYRAADDALHEARRLLCGEREHRQQLHHERLSSRLRRAA